MTTIEPAQHTSDIRSATVADLLDPTVPASHHIGVLPGDNYWLAIPHDVAEGAHIDWLNVVNVRRDGVLVAFEAGEVGYGEHPDAPILLRAVA